MDITPIISKQKYGLVAEEITRLIKENVFKEGTQLPTEAELYYSKEAALLMAYKWSNDKRFHKLYQMFADGDDYGKRVVARFEELKEKGELPARLDPEGTVARFVGDNFTEHRFVL